MLWTRKAPTLLKTLHQCPRSPKALQASREDLKDGTEKLLLPKWVLWSRNRGQEGVFLGMSFTVGHQVCSCLRYLYPIDVGFHLQLFYQLPGLRYAGSVVAGHWSAGWVFQTRFSVPKAWGSLADLAWLWGWSEKSGFPPVSELICAGELQPAQPSSAVVGAAHGAAAGCCVYV